MLKVNLEKKYINKVDVFIINHSLHHCANPSNCLDQISKYLKKNGVVLINEPETSFMLKLLQVLLDDESWSLTDDIFNKNKNLLIQKTLGFQILLLPNFYLKINIYFRKIFLNIS